MTMTFDMSECVLFYVTVLFAGCGSAMYACCAFVLKV